MTSYLITNLHTGVSFGIYAAGDAAAAVAAMLRDAGYPDVRSEGGRLVFPDDETARLCGDLDEAWSAEPCPATRRSPPASPPTTTTE